MSLRIASETILSRSQGVAKVDLIIPGTTESPRYSVVNDFLAPGYLAAALRKGGHAVIVRDVHSFALSETALLEEIGERRPHLVGFCLHSYDNVDSMRRLASGVRSRLPNCLIVCGGEHASYTASWQLEHCTSLDCVLIGEGERAVLLLAEAALGSISVAAVPGIVVRGEVARPPLGNIERLDDIAWPDHDIIEKCAAQGVEASLSIMTSRGCLGTCNFCNARSFMNTGQAVPFRRRSVEDVVNEIEHLLSRYSDKPAISDVIGFQDVSFLDLVPRSRQWLADFVAEVRRRGIFFNFFIHARANNIVRLQDLVEALVSIGLVQVEVGLESGTQGQLDLFHKGIRLEHNLQAIHILKTLGVSYGSSGFLMFHPYVRFNDLEANARFLGLIRHGLFDVLSSRFQVLPGAAILGQLEREGKLLPEYHPEAVFAYRYEDDRIGELCAAANGAYLDVLEQIEMARYIALRLAVAQSQLTRWGLWSPRLQASGHEIDHMSNDLVDVHAKSFLQMCKISQRGSNDYEAIRRILVEHSAAAEERLADAFEAFVADVGIVQSERVTRTVCQAM